MLAQKGEATIVSQQKKEAKPWKDSWKEAGWIFLLSRLILLVITFIGPSRFSLQNGKLSVPPQDCALHIKECLFSWNSWDVGVIMDLAINGYHHKDLSAFFPLWPLIMHVFAVPFVSGNPSDAFFLTGMILANLCFFFSLVLFYRLVNEDFDATIARYALFLLALNPYALFFFIGYSEALFLLLCLAMFYFLRRGARLDWWYAGIIGGLAVLTRGSGLVLIIPYLIIFVQRFWQHRTAPLAHWRTLLNAALPMLFIPLCLLGYMLYLYKTMGDPTAFSTWEWLAWGRRLNFPWAGIIRDIQSFVIKPANFTSNFTDLLFTLVPIGILIAGWKRLPLYYSLFALVSMIYSLCYPIDGFGYALAASPRYMMVVFPIFVVLALWCKSPRIKSFVMTISVVFFTINALLFITHSWVA